MDDFGDGLGCAWRETDVNSANRARCLIRNLLEVQQVNEVCSEEPDK
jgi:hypothetical protein